jgi:hypothetical protein
MAIAEVSVVNNAITVDVSGTSLLTPLVAAAAASAAAADASADSAATSAAVVKLFVPTTPTAALARIVGLRLFNHDPAKFYSVRYFWHKDVDTRFRITIQGATDTSDTGVADVAELSIDADVAYTGITEVTLSEVSGSGVTASAVIDFGDGTPTWGMYSGGWATSGISPRAFETVSVWNDAVDDRADARVTALRSPGTLKPFADGVALSDNLRNRVRDLRVTNTSEGHTYSLSTLTLDNNGAGARRLRIEVRDNVLGRMVCSISMLSEDGATVADFVATLPPRIVLLDDIVSPSSNRRQTLAQIELDLDGVTAEFANLGSDTTFIHPDNLLTKEQQRNYLTDHRADVVVTVGSGQEYETIDLAQAAIYAANTGSSNINGQPVSDDASYHRRVRLFLTDAATYPYTSSYLANFCEIDGVPGAVMFCEAPALSGALEIPGTHKAFNVKVTHGSTTKYAAHLDDVNRSVSEGGQFVFQYKYLEGLTLENPDGNDTQVLGGGISSGEYWVLRGVWAENLNEAATAAAIGIHNSGVLASVPSSKLSPYSATVDMSGCGSPNLLGLDLYSVAPGPLNTAILRDNSFRMIRIGANIADADSPDRVADRYVWKVQGRYDGPIKFSDGNGQPVLQTTPGQTPSGTAAALIFGTVDELGRGDLWIKTGTTKSLGARLGDCSSVNKALTIGAQTHTFTTDLTAAANSTIISAINASITTHPVSEVDIQTEYAVACQPKARMANSTGATIPKGRFVKRTGASTVALAGVGDVIFGWTYRAILNGLTGYVLTARQIEETQIEGASSGSGAWGLAAGGLLDYAAATKVGVTAGGIVEH